MSVLNGLQPKRVFEIFEAIAAIPHGSGNTDAISSWCCSFIRNLGIKACRDNVGNVLAYKNGSAGREEEAPIILQAHLDMVCEKTADKVFDFTKDGIQVKTDGQTVWADGTTLGADNGIGLAMILAVLEDTTLSHPPVEAVLTIDEETGLEGAINVDFATLQGRRMINLDSEDEGVFTAGCAGGVRMEALFPLTFVPNHRPAYRVHLKDLWGGHSGIEINQGRCNANRALADFILTLQQQNTVDLCSFSGGSVENAIPSEAACVIATDLTENHLLKLAQNLVKTLQEQGESAASVVVEAVSEPLVMHSDCTKAILTYMTESPNGVQAMCKDLPDLVETSLNLGVVRQNEQTLSVLSSLRSSVETEKQALLARLQELAAQKGADTTVSGDYPGWEYRADSALQDTMKQVYAKLTGNEPVVNVIHAGLECGLFCQKCPELDAISMGPNMKNVHTPEERVEVASVERVYAFLIALLEQL